MAPVKVESLLTITLLLPLSALGTTMYSNDVQLFVAVSSGSPNDPQYTSNPGGLFDGVARLDISVAGQLAEICSGVLIDSTHVLTAAHCVNYAGVDGITVSFEAGGPTYAASSWVFDPLFNELHPSNGNDLGVLTLSSPVIGITPYQIYLGSGLGMTIDIAGFGQTDTSGNGLGEFRHGQNQYDSSNPAVYAFNLDTIGEVMTCQGDSGGPSFINGQLAGIHSYGDPGCATFGADIPLNQPLNLAFIQANSDVIVVPEPDPRPFLASVLAAGLCILARRHRRQKRRS